MAMPYIEQIEVVPRRGQWSVRLVGWWGEEPDRHHSTVYEGPYKTIDDADEGVELWRQAAKNGRAEFAKQPRFSLRT